MSGARSGAGDSPGSSTVPGHGPSAPRARRPAPDRSDAADGRPRPDGRPALAPPAPAVFLDRDGTLVRDFRHGADPAALTLLPGVVPALRRLQAAGYRLVVVTNQAGVARGLFTVGEARAAGRHVVAILAAAGVRLAGYHLAPYHADGVVPRFAIDHPDRKPGPGMLVRAAAVHRLDLGRSWIVGDSLADLGAGLASGVRPLLVDIGAVAFAAAADLPGALRDGRAGVVCNLPHAAAVILDGAAPEPAARLVRPPRPPGARRPGQPSPWPNAAWLVRAAVDGAALVPAVARR